MRVSNGVRVGGGVRVGSGKRVGIGVRVGDGKRVGGGVRGGDGKRVGWAVGGVRVGDGILPYSGQTWTCISKETTLFRGVVSRVGGRAEKSRESSRKKKKNCQQFHPSPLL